MAMQAYRLAQQITPGTVMKECILLSMEHKQNNRRNELSIKR